MKTTLISAFALLFSLCFLPHMQAQAPGKRILLEKVTSAGCPGCPNGDLILESMLAADSNLIVVAIHRNDYWHTDSMKSPDGNAILSEYLWAHPTVMVDRIKWDDFSHVCLLSHMWQPKVDLRKNDPPRASIGAVSTYDPPSRTLNVQVNGVAIANLNNDYRLNAYLVESPVLGHGPGYDQLNGNNATPGSPLFGLGDTIPNYVHKWVLRDMLGGPLGEAATVPMPAPPGTPFSHTFSTTVDPRWDENNLTLVVLIQKHNPDPLEREILNAQVVPLNGSVLADIPAGMEATGFSIYPQPAGYAVNIELPAASSWTLDLMDVQGRIVSQSKFTGTSTQLERKGLPAGLYLLKARNAVGREINGKLVFE